MDCITPVPHTSDSSRPKQLAVGTALGGDDSDVESVTSDYEVGPEESKAGEAESKARTLRKKAGLPELELDALPSTVVPKILWLVTT